MGNYILLKKKIYNQQELAIIHEEIKENINNLREYYEMIRHETYLDEDRFVQIVMNFVNQNFATQIFQVLSDSKGRLFFNDFIAFYYVFISQDSINRIKTNFWLNILFSNREEIPEDIYKQNVKLFFINEHELLQEDFINSIKSHKKKGIINKSAFIKAKGNSKLELFYPKIIVKKYQPSSNIQAFNRDICYLCDCVLQERKQKEEEEKKLGIDKDKKELLKKIENVFKMIEKKNKGVFPLSEFDYLLSLMKIEMFQRKFFLQYVNKVTKYKQAITFKEFTDLIDKIALANNEDSRNELAYEILSLQEKEIKKEEINNLLNNAFPKENYSYNNSINVDIFKEDQSLFEIRNIFNKFFDTFNLIPYIIFKAEPKTPIIMKRCIDFYCDGKDIPDIPQEILLNQEKVYCIDSKFVKSLKEYYYTSGNKGIKLEPNLKGIFDENERLVKKYKQDFFVIHPDLYIFLSNIFKYKSPEFKIIEYDIKESNIEEYKKKNKDVLLEYSEEKGHFKEIDFYPWKVYFYKFHMLYIDFMERKVKQKDYIDEMVSIFKSSEKKISVGDKFSRKKTLQSIIINDLWKHLNQFKNPKFYYFKNKQVNLIQNNDITIEECGTKRTCYLLLDDDFIDSESGITTSSYDALFNREKFLALKEKKLKEKEGKEKNENRIESKEGEEETKEISLKKKEKQEEKFCLPFGLNNMGNTCYMNSVLQILFNLPNLRDFLFDERIKYFINRRSKFSHKGKFIDEFLKYINLRWKPRPKKDKDSINPKNLKEIAGKIQNQFDNDEQQDANEFLNFILDELNEELNIKNDRPYIRNLDDCFFHNTEEELSNIYWANSIRKTTSFINALFTFQLKSVLTCTECHNETISYESNTDLYVPVPLGKYINVSVFIFKLPICYKLYYETISKEFQKFKENHKDLNEYALLNNFFKEKNFNILKYSAPSTTDLTLDKTKTIADFKSIIRSYKILEFEDEKTLPFENNEYNYLINNLTSFIVCSGGRDRVNYFYDEMTIDESFPNNSTVYVFEVLNSNGIAAIRKTQQKKPLLIHKTLNKTKRENLNEEGNYTISTGMLTELPKEDSQQKTEENKNQIISFNNLLFYQKKKRLKEIENLSYEFPMQIVHFSQFSNLAFILYPLQRNQINFHLDFILFNNTKFNYTGRELYEFIWEKYRKFLKNPDKKDSELWWRTPNENHKNCYPFTMKICKSINGLYVCSKCKWYNFCSGCIINPGETEPVISSLNDVLLVEWCGMLEQKEFDKNKKQIKTVLMETDRIDPNKYNEPEKSLYDCIDLFLAKETLEDELRCGKCNQFKTFYKSYQFDKLPPVLIISLKRFKFTSVYNNKISTFIQYPIHDLKINNEFFDLYGIINHMGSLNGGHYTSIAKVNDKWLYFDDSSILEIKEERVLSINAYILVYINKKPIEQQMYLSAMISIMNKLNIKDCDDYIQKNKDKILTIETDGIFGEPIDTIYGNGYYLGKRDNGFIEVQFLHGKGVIKKEYKGKRQIIMPTCLKIGAKLKDEVDEDETKTKQSPIIKEENKEKISHQDNIENLQVVSKSNLNNAKGRSKRRERRNLLGIKEQCIVF